MPLIIISGLPASGKSTRAQELHKYFSGRSKSVHIVSENVAIPKAGFQKNDYFASSQNEKIVRADLKSETIRLLNKHDVVILDAGNYIKGYRYELYCASKAARTPQCTLFCGAARDVAWQMNSQRAETVQAALADDSAAPIDNSSVAYTREIFDALCMRFEEPVANSRWDAPLFVCIPSHERLDLDAIYAALYECKAPPPNLSTQNVSIWWLFFFPIFIEVEEKFILQKYKFVYIILSLNK